MGNMAMGMSMNLGGMSVMIPTQNPMDFAESDLSTAMPSIPVGGSSGGNGTLGRSSSVAGHLRGGSSQNMQGGGAGGIDMMRSVSGPTM